MYEKDKLKNDIEHYISADKVFTEEDERRVFEKISKAENNKSRTIKTVMPQILSFIGIAALICIIAGIFLYQDILNEQNRNAEDTETIEKEPEISTEPEEEKVVEEEQPPTPISNDYNIFKIKVGDKVGEWTVIEKDNGPENFKSKSYKTRFIGNQKVTGTIKKQTVKHNDFPAWDTYVFIPDDVLKLPNQKSSNHLPYIIFNYEQEPSLMDLNLELGESIDNVELRIKYVTNIVSSAGTAYPSIQLLNEQDKDYIFESVNAPDEYIDSGILYQKFMSDRASSDVQFAEKTGGILYAVDGTDSAFIRKDNELILTISLSDYAVDYEYLNEFKETILVMWSDRGFYTTLLSDLDRFMQTGENITTTSYKIYDQDGNLHLDILRD
jgi:hypothetical protein